MTQPRADEPGAPRPDQWVNALTPASRSEHPQNALQVSVGESTVLVQEAPGGHSGRKLVSNATPVAVNIPVTLPRFLRRKWLVAMIFIVGSAVSLPYIWYTMKPNYLANGVLRFKPQERKLAYQTELNSTMPRYDAYVNTQVTIIKSSRVLAPVLQRSEVRQTEWYREIAATAGTDLEGRMIPALQKVLDVNARSRTELMDVSMQLPYPESAAVLINAVMDEYVKYAQSEMKGEEEWLAEALTKVSAGLKKEIAGLIATKYNLAKRIGTIDSASLGLQLAQHLNLLEAEHLQLKRRLEMTNWEIHKFSTADGLDSELVEGDDAGDLTSPEEAARQYANDSKWQELFSKLEKTRYDLDVARQSYGERHPNIRQLLLDLDFGERMLREREVQLDEEWATRSYAQQPVNMDHRFMLRQYAKRTEQELQLVREEMERQRARVADIGDIALELAQYEEQIKNKRETHDLIRKRLEALQMEANVPPARISMAAQAIAPTSPAKDRRKVLSVASVVGALVGGLVLAYLRASTDRTIYDAAEIQRMYRIPMLGLLPEFKATDMPREYGGASLVSEEADQERYLYPRHVLIESMRTIRTTLLERMPQQGKGPGHILLITSALPRTGKTTVAHLLSESLAMVGKRVLLVEADVHKPVLAKRMGMEKGPGLAALMSGTIEDTQAIRPSGQANLDVLVVGEHAADFDSESMASSRFLGYLDKWKQSYDIIILDSPPVLVTADTLILAGYANSTLLVLRSSHDRTLEAAECYSQLTSAGGKPIGTLMIGGRFMPYRRYGGYKYGYGYGYRYWYKYGHDYVQARHHKNRGKAQV